MNLILGLATMTVCLLLQGLLVVAALRYYARREQHTRSSFLGAMRVTSGIMVILIIGNIAQITVWGVLFLLLGEFSELRTAVYHSGVNFATLGYGDIVMSERHRVLGPLEAVNGALMIGVSTAALSRVFSEIVRVQVGPGHGVGGSGERVEDRTRD